MASKRVTLALGAAIAATGLCAVSVNSVAANIYSCEVSGRKVTSDRPITNCDRDQRILNPDGSARGRLAPSMPADAQAEAEARERATALERANRQETIRRDRNLLMRFPNEAKHRTAREAALDDVRKALKVSQTRLELLAKERKPLLDDAEFYIGKQLPGRLKQQLDANEAAADAQRALVQNQEGEIVRINTLYDAEQERLRKLWSGAQPGSMGTLPPVQAPASAASSARRATASNP